MSDPEITELCKRLAEPFEPSELQYKPQKVNGTGRSRSPM